jgi:hypothetical protein
VAAGEAPKAKELDVTGENLGPRPKPKLEDIERDREKARRWLAYGLLSLLSVTVLSLLVADFARWIDLNDTKDLATAILAPIVVLTGTVLAFYFGGNSA